MINLTGAKDTFYRISVWICFADYIEVDFKDTVWSKEQLVVIKNNVSQCPQSIIPFSIIFPLFLYTCNLGVHYNFLLTRY